MKSGSRAGVVLELKIDLIVLARHFAQSPSHLSCRSGSRPRWLCQRGGDWWRSTGAKAKQMDSGASYLPDRGSGAAQRAGRGEQRQQQHEAVWEDGETTAVRPA